MSKLWFVFIIFVLFLSGCAVQSVAPKEAAPEPKAGTEEADKTSEPNCEPEITASPDLPPTPTVQIIGSASPIPICAGEGILDTHGEDFGIPGMLFYQHTNDRGISSGLFAIGGTPIKQAKFPIEVNSNIHMFGVSQDGNWLAYSPEMESPDNQMDFDNPTIVLIGADGKQQTHMLDTTWLQTINEPGYRLVRFVWGYWLNDQLIFALVNSKIPGDDIGVGRFYLALLDPFEGAWKVEVLDYLPEQTGHWSAAISPDLTRILYDATGTRLIEIADNSVIQLWQIGKGGFPSMSAARWSPDGLWAVFADQGTPARLFIISRDGKNVYEIQNAEMGSFFKDFYWSANSWYFAYVSKIYPENSPDKYNLLVFDVEQSKFILECPILEVDLPLPELTWSPDSKMIAISQKSGSLRILDVATGSLINMNIDGVGVGWSDKYFLVDSEE
jgi:hypothetical protein